MKNYFKKLFSLIVILLFVLLPFCISSFIIIYYFPSCPTGIALIIIIICSIIPILIISDVIDYIFDKLDID